MRTTDKIKVRNKRIPNEIKELVKRITRDKEGYEAWLNIPHPDLGGRTAQQCVNEGRAGAVITLLSNAFSGIPA
jgi:hypothetical protein